MEYIEQKSEEVEEDLPMLATWLRSANPYNRRLARKLLHRAGVDAVGPLLTLLEEEAQIHQSRRALRYGLSALTIGGYLWWVSHLSQPYFWPLGLLLLLPFSVDIALSVASRAQIEAAQILARLQDVRAVGPLAEALEFKDLWKYSGTNWIAADALCRLLPQLRAEDAGLLNERQLACLYRVLNAPMPQNPRLSLAILEALSRIGDIRALPTIARLAGMQPTTLSGRELRDAAHDCLLSLQERLETQRAPRTLLRAAGVEARPDHLLHPVGNPEQDPSELLRPTDQS